jgi:hypothetical protein
LAVGDVRELWVVRRDPREEGPGPSVIAGPFLEVCERVPEPEMVLTWPLDRVGLASEQADGLGDAASVGEGARGDDAAFGDELSGGRRGRELLP